MTAQGLKSTSLSVHSFSKRKHYSTLTRGKASRDYLLIPVTCSNSVTLRSHRRYSTIPGQGITSNKETVPISSIQPHKPKVDLRPAPKKASKEVRPANPPPPPTQITQKPHQSTSSPSNSTAADTRKSSEHLGPFESTKYDFAEATRRGVFAPLPEGTSKIGAVWHNLKQYFWFYYRGLKLILVAHRRQAAAIKQRIKDAEAKGEDALMTRSETRFLQSYNRNLFKLLPFVVTVLILEEAIPFIVLYAPRLLPSTCLLPSQQERIEDKRRSKQRSHIAIAKMELGQIEIAPTPKGVSSLSPELSLAVAGIFATPTYGPSFWIRHRISQHLRHLAKDDVLLSREGNGSSLQDGELTEALEERGIILNSSLTQQEKLAMLHWWLKSAQDENSRLQLVLQFAKDTRLD
ncbi:hypothetical protein Clacol_000334 [Clathrus columnatus]|uniref:Letm1 RBD domain-containing protein n=1 Tax=Clathrus columnatus TaxID=1419009 RepID=A0AAV5A2M9_9AGAM|nr:hypothetical protein Clacol_000334 [Clathrus columnatus]